MCRLIAYRGEPVVLHDVLFEPSHSIIAQSYRSLERRQPVSGDGFGFGWYDSSIADEPALYRSVRPAWSDPNLRGLARLLRSGHFFVHVRGADPGMEVCELNCHPFAWDRFLFMHNGLVAEFPRVRLELRRRLRDEAFLAVRGNTDSEYLFGVFIDRWLEAGSPRDYVELEKVFRSTIRFIVELLEGLEISSGSELNLAITDGDSTFASRFATSGAEAPSLYIATETAHEPGSRSVLVASERLDRESRWDCVPPNSLVGVESDLALSIAPLVR